MIDIPYYLVTPQQSDLIQGIDGFNIEGRVYGTYFGILYKKQTVDESSFAQQVLSYNPEIVNIPTATSGSL